MSVYRSFHTFPMDLPPERACVLMDHFHAALRRHSDSQTSSSYFREDGMFEARLGGALPVDGEGVEVEWIVVRSPQGSVEEIGLGVEGEFDAPSRLRAAATELLRNVTTAAFAERTEDRFIRTSFHYVGPNLDGEYWLPGFRVAPAIPDDEVPSARNLERVLLLDQTVRAVDGQHAVELGSERARRHAARLSLLLDRGLYYPRPDKVWVRARPSGGHGPNEAARYQRGFPLHELRRDTMPGKGEECPLGRFHGSLTDWRFGPEGRLTLPVETRRLLRAIDSGDFRTREAFDACVRLYRVALLVERTHPTAGLAYRVAAAEAVATTTGEFRNFSEFIRAQLGEREGLDGLLNFLYGPVRSAHFHAGRFPLGEYLRMSADITDPGREETRGRHLRGQMLIRAAIVKWALGLVGGAAEKT